MSVWFVIVVDIYVSNNTNKFLKVVYVVKVRQLFCKHSKIVLSVECRAVQTEKMLCVVLYLVMSGLLRTKC